MFSADSARRYTALIPCLKTVLAAPPAAPHCIVRLTVEVSRFDVTVESSVVFMYASVLPPRVADIDNIYQVLATKVPAKLF